MSVAKETARAQIAALVEKFGRLSAKDRASYNEAQTRHSFILPLFRALGWDTANPDEVTAEEQISRGFVDFGFYLGGVPVFYLETKKIPERLDDPRWATQAINYAWHKDVTWAVLTDFEGLKVLNAEWQETNPARAVALDLRWERYANGDFEDLWLLSKEAMQAGELNRQAERWGKKTKKHPVNELLFAQLTEWRHELFRQIRGWNPNLWTQDLRAVDNAVQRLIDRLIFIRTVEDRGIERPRLRALVREFQDSRKKDKNLFADLLALFRELDTVYDANLFAESSLDHLEMHDPLLLTRIIDGLYGLRGGYISYDFNAIDADVLGAIYEQYLSFKAQDPEGKAVIDLEKRSKRKAQGIYYTPQFVVRYIVQNTLGRLLEEGADPHALRILDPACGSGSFLIEAFDVLDRWLARHGTEEDKAFPRRRRLRILQENLYGVDLDEQAVEVARLNLLLRAAGERERLPMLTHIRRGNSLIDDPAVAGDAAFRWEEEFPEVMARGGFDVVIGNPPYIRIQTLPREHVAWMAEHYESATANYDIYVPFVERGLSLLNPQGLMAYILPHKFFQAKYGRNLRRLISEGQHLVEVVHFGDHQVFEGASTYTCIMTLSKARHDGFTFVEVQDVEKWIQGNGSIQGQIDTAKVSDSEWSFVVGSGSRLYDRLSEIPIKLGDISQPFVGLQTSADTVFLFKDFKALERGTTTVYSKQLEKWVTIESALLKQVIRSGHISRYWAEPTALVLFPYVFVDGTACLVSQDVLEREYPNAWLYLKENEELLRGREHGKFDGEGWYQLYPKNLDLWEQPKIMIPYMVTRFAAYLDFSNAYFVNVTTGGFGLTVPSNHGSLEFFTGLFNSTLLDFYMKSVSTNFRGGYFAANKQFLVRLPIRTIDFSDPADVARHDRMVALVERMLDLKQQHAAAEVALDDRRHALAEQIAHVDREIDALVYELYGLTAEEIAIVEEQG